MKIVLALKISQRSSKSHSKIHEQCFQFSRSVMSDSLWPRESQHARSPCLSPTPRDHPNPCVLSQWCHPTISSSVVMSVFFFLAYFTLYNRLQFKREIILKEPNRAEDYNNWSKKKNTLEGNNRLHVIKEWISKQKTRVIEIIQVEQQKKGKKNVK